MRRALVVGIVTILCASAGWYAYRVLSRPTPEELWELPEFSEPGPGPRAPRADALNVTLGVTTLDEVQALIAARGVSCSDTSMRALIQARRAKQEAEAEAKGEADDATSSASKRPGGSPSERNPQVRLSCTDVEARTLGDRERPHAVGRWLFIFDSPKHPLRHVSYRRMHRSQTPALKDATSAVAALTDAYGPPTVVTPEPGLPPVPAVGAAAVPRLVPFKVQWDYADLLVQVTLLNFGARGVDVLESVEVPWPVRAEAPARPAG